MCSNPHIIHKPCPDYMAALNPLHPDSEHFRALKLWSYGHPSAQYSSRDIVVPCGKCIDCLKKRQNDIALRAEREASVRGSMHLVTLTYDDKYLPFAMRLDCVDTESGVVTSDPYVIVTRSENKEQDIDSGLRESLLYRFRNQVAGKKPIYLVEPIGFLHLDEPNIFYQYSFTPSLNRRDVRLHIKNFRVKYKRQFKESIDFSYLLCGEMGPRTCRPHYHLVLFGLSNHQVRMFCRLWKYGFTNWQRVKAVNRDNTSGYSIAAKYVAKYVSKGTFECESVISKCAEKPRLCCSKHLGCDNITALIPYYRGYDIYGEYNPDSLIFKDSGLIMTKEQQFKLFSVIGKRTILEINGHDCPLPSYLIRKIWYVYEKEKQSYRPLTLRALYSAQLMGNFIADRCRKLQEYILQHPSKDISETISEFQAVYASASLYKDKVGKEDLQRFYSQSLF